MWLNNLYRRGRQVLGKVNTMNRAVLCIIFLLLGLLLGLLLATPSDASSFFVTGGGTGSGTGDVTGPGSSTDGYIVLWDGVAGDTVKDSTIDPTTLVVGPGSATDGYVALFDGTTGKLLKDSSIDPAAIGDVVGPAGATDGYVALFDGVTGKLLKDSTLDPSTIVIGPASATDGYIALFDGTTGKLLKDGVATTTYQLASHYSTFYVPAGAMIARTTNPAAYGSTEEASNDVMVSYFAFDGGATEEHAQFSVVMPETWDRSTVKVKFIWASATSSTAGDTVEWGIRAAAVSNDDALDTSWGTAVTVSDTLLADNGTDQQTTAATGALTVGGTPALGDLIFFDVYRNTDGTDDMTEDAWLIGIVVQYLSNQVPAGW
jgi:hypothetical protein